MRAFISLITISLVSTSAMTSTSLAQSATAFDRAIDDALFEAGEERRLLHCAGLFRALGETAPEDTDLSTLTNEMEADMAVFAAVVHQSETGVEAEEAMDVIAPAVFAVSNLYLDRIRANQTAKGSVLDPEMEEQLAFCRELRDRLTEGTE